MPVWRVTVRYGRPQEYAMEDVDAGTLAEAMRLAAERVAAASNPTADLVEIRIQADPEGRRFVEG